MSCLSWNFSGLGNPTTVQAFVDIVYSKQPNLIFLMETKLNTSRIQSVKHRIGFVGLFCVNSLGLSGGLSLLWNTEINVDVLSYSRNHIDAKVTSLYDPNPWRFTGFYGNPKRNKRRDSWSLMKHLHSQSNLPWALMGDFNDLRSADEKQGSTPHPQWLCRGFDDAINCCELRELDFKGCQFTWEKSRGTTQWVREKLDRILVSASWLDIFEGAKAKSLEAPVSDHLPLVLWPIPVVRSRSRGSFKFGNSWIREIQCREIV